MTEMLGIKSLDDNSRNILEATIMERVKAGDNSNQLLEIIYKWEDDTRIYKGLPPRDKLS